MVVGEAQVEEALSRAALPAWQRSVMVSVLAHHAAAATAAVVVADEAGGGAVDVAPELVESLRESVAEVLGWDREAARAWLVRVMRAHGAIRGV